MEKGSSSSASKSNKRKRKRLVSKDKGKRKRLVSEEKTKEQTSSDYSSSSSCSRSCSCQIQNFSEMTKDELLELCHGSERPRARRVIDLLRTYLIQRSESQGFDIDVFPGHFYCLTTVIPVGYSNAGLRDYDEHHALANLGITEYNAENNETEFEVVKVEKVNVHIFGLVWKYYITFNARNVKANGDLKTFQTITDVDRSPPYTAYAVLCRPKPN